MADPAFWRELAATFLQIPGHDLIRADGQYTVGSGEAWTWRLAGSINDFIRNTFESLATRGAFEIAPAGTTDLANAWLEAIRKERINFRSEQGGTEVDEEGREGRQYVLGTINGVCEASATLCRILEKRAIQAEFEQKQRADPKNWPYVRQRYETFKQIKELISGPREKVSETFLRNALAEQYGINPEEVSKKQIQLGLADLGRHYHAISLVPSEPTQPEQPPGETETTQPVANSRPNPKALRDSYFANFPDEKIKIRDLCWAVRQHRREWTRWLAEKLKDGSTPDLAFRRILTSGKRPREFDKTPRPKGWE
jgi:hypothetical protein